MRLTISYNIIFFGIPKTVVRQLYLIMNVVGWYNGPHCKTYDFFFNIWRPVSRLVSYLQSWFWSLFVEIKVLFKKHIENMPQKRIDWGLY